MTKLVKSAPAATGLEIPAFLDRTKNGIKPLPVNTVAPAAKVAPATGKAELSAIAAKAIESGKVAVVKVAPGLTAEKAKAATAKAANVLAPIGKAKAQPVAPAKAKAAPAKAKAQPVAKAAKAGKVAVAKVAPAKAKAQPVAKAKAKAQPAKVARKVAVAKAIKAGKVAVAKAEPRAILKPATREAARVVKTLSDTYTAPNGITLRGKNAILIQMMKTGATYGELKAALGWKNCRVTAGRVAARCGFAVAKSGGKGDESFFKLAPVGKPVASAKEANALLNGKAGKAKAGKAKAAPATGKAATAILRAALRKSVTVAKVAPAKAKAAPAKAKAQPAKAATAKAATGKAKAQPAKAKAAPAKVARKR